MSYLPLTSISYLTLHTTAHLNELHLRVNEELSRYERMAQDASRTKALCRRTF